MNSIMESEGPQFQALTDDIEDILKQFFIDTATWGLEGWEKEFQIPSDKSKPIEQRRAVVKSKKRGIGKVNVLLIKNIAESYDGGTVEVVNEAGIYRLTLIFIDTIGIPPNIEDLQKAIDEIKPSHYQIKYDFKYNTYDLVSTYTHNLLSGYTYEQIRSSAL